MASPNIDNTSGVSTAACMTTPILNTTPDNHPNLNQLLIVTLFINITLIPTFIFKYSIISIDSIKRPKTSKIVNNNNNDNNNNNNNNNNKQLIIIIIINNNNNKQLIIIIIINN